MESNSRILATLVFLSLWAGCRTSPSTNSLANGVQKATEADQVMERLKLQSYGMEGLKWELMAPVGETFSEGGHTFVKNLIVDLFEGSQKSSTVRADEGILYVGRPADDSSPTHTLPSHIKLEPGDMYLSGHVVLVSTEGNKMTTDWAHYKKKFNLIVSTAPVEVVRSDSLTKGIGLEATPDMSSVKIFQETLVIPERPGESGF